MKKRFIVPIIAIVVAVAVVALSACGGTTLNTSGTATYGEVGVEFHNYFPYATVTVDSKGVATAIEIGEAFGPTGKLMIQNGTPAYRNPWYPGIAKISTAVENTENDTIEKKQAVVADKYFISIDGKVFKLTVLNVISGNVRDDILVFVATDDSAIQLTDRYLANNMRWYIDAIKADKVFICDAAGTKLEATADITLPDQSTEKATFVDGALLKNDAKSTYQPGRGLKGEYFKQAMDELAAYAMEKNFAIEYEKAAGGNWEGLRIKGLTLSVHADDETVTGATSKESDTFLNYSASYMKVAEKAFALAKAQLF